MCLAHPSACFQRPRRTFTSLAVRRDGISYRPSSTPPPLPCPSSSRRPDPREMPLRATPFRLSRAARRGKAENVDIERIEPRGILDWRIRFVRHASLERSGRHPSDPLHPLGRLRDDGSPSSCFAAVPYHPVLLPTFLDAMAGGRAANAFGQAARECPHGLRSTVSDLTLRLLGSRTRRLLRLASLGSRNAARRADWTDRARRGSLHERHDLLHAQISFAALSYFRSQHDN